MRRAVTSHMLALAFGVAATADCTRQGADLSRPELQRIGSFGDLVGYWQFGEGSDRYVAVLDKNPTRDEDELRVFARAGGQWRLVRRAWLRAPGAETLDGHAFAGAIFVCIEVNGNHPLALLVADYRFLIGAAEGSVIPIGPLALTSQQLGTVQVPLSAIWNVMMLEPSAWLFSPRFVRGSVRGPLVVASTADGQVALVGPGIGSPGTELHAPRIRNAVEPQAVLEHEGLIVAFLRPREDEVYPFWLRQRYPRPGSSINGDLVVTQGSRPELNLSAGLGPVTRFALAPANDGGLWIFALIDAPVGTDVVALERAKDKWMERERRSFDREFRDVSAEAGANPGEWHLVYQTASAEGSTLEYQTWQLGR